jgi:flagellar basal body rod protein FlgB
MFIERLINQTNAPLLGKVVSFAAERHKVLAENIVNISTPGFVARDLDVSKFQGLLRERLEVRSRSAPGTVEFDDLPTPTGGMAGLMFQDGARRSMEQLMTDSAKNALFHNLMVELLKKSYGSIESALKERVA